jgi:hypothetical protein
MLHFEWNLKLYFLHMKSNEVGTTLKHPQTINGNVKNLSKIYILLYLSLMKDKGECKFYFNNLILPLISRLLASFYLQNEKKKLIFQLLLLCFPNPTICLQKRNLKTQTLILNHDCLRALRHFPSTHDIIATFFKIS